MLWWLKRSDPAPIWFSGGLTFSTPGAAFIDTVHAHLFLPAGKTLEANGIHARKPNVGYLLCYTMLLSHVLSPATPLASSHSHFLVFPSPTHFLVWTADHFHLKMCSSSLVSCQVVCCSLPRHPTNVFQAPDFSCAIPPCQVLWDLTTCDMSFFDLCFTHFISKLWKYSKLTNSPFSLFVSTLCTTLGHWANCRIVCEVMQTKHDPFVKNGAFFSLYPKVSVGKPQGRRKWAFRGLFLSHYLSLSSCHLPCDCLRQMWH